MQEVREFLEQQDWPKESLDMLDFVMTVEDQFDIVITDADMAETRTMEDLIKLVERKVNDKK